MAAEQEVIRAFSHYDSSVFLGWIEAVGDVMVNGGETSNQKTAANLGGMFMALANAASELQERELHGGKQS